MTFSGEHNQQLEITTLEQFKELIYNNDVAKIEVFVKEGWEWLTVEANTESLDELVEWFKKN